MADIIPLHRGVTPPSPQGVSAPKVIADAHIYRGNVKPIDPDVIVRIMGEEPFACLNEEPPRHPFIEGIENAVIVMGFVILGIGAALMVFA